MVPSAPGACSLGAKGPVFVARGPTVCGRSTVLASATERKGFIGLARAEHRHHLGVVAGSGGLVGASL
jgi:hypothetical protein